MYEYTSNGSRAIMTLYFRSKTVFESGTYHFSKEDKVGVLFGGDVAYYPVWNPKVENEKNEYYNIESGTLYIDVNAGDYTIRFDGLVENGVAVKLYYYGDKVYLQEPQ